MAQAKTYILIGSAIVLAVLALVTLIRAVLGPRFTDRVIAVNMMNTMVVALICILSVWLKEDYLVDVALLYALLSFLTVVVLHRLVMARKRRSERKRQTGGEKA